ncbi:MAG: hypothetical protein EON89_08280 [Brevundimonas sp.]|nr:MAG: hypothetical protein EON89_08280 [Brevundimonas sp.]
MSIFKLAGAICVALFFASSARAEPFDDFVDHCLRTNADQQAVANSAKGDGWFALPPEVFGADADFEDPQLFISEDPAAFGDKGPPADLSMIITGWGEGENVFQISGVRLDVCVVGAQTTTANADRLRERLETLMGFPPVEYDGERLWLFSRLGEGFHSESGLVDLDDTQLPEIARRQKIYFAGVIEEDNFIGVIMAAVRPST